MLRYPKTAWPNILDLRCQIQHVGPKRADLCCAASTSLRALHVSELLLGLHRGEIRLGIVVLFLNMSRSTSPASPAASPKGRPVIAPATPPKQSLDMSLEQFLKTVKGAVKLVCVGDADALSLCGLKVLTSRTAQIKPGRPCRWLRCSHQKTWLGPRWSPSRNLPISA